MLNAVINELVKGELPKLPKKKPLEILTLETDRKQILRKRCEPVKSTKDFRPYIDEMKVIIPAYKGVGLAAPQVGICKRFFVVRTGKDRYEVFINPLLVKASDESKTYTEGCLSIPEMKYFVKRPRRIVIKCLTEQLKPVKMKFHDEWAAIILHEMEHLDGILICDY